MLLPEMHLSSTGIERDGATYIEIQISVSRRRVHELDWPRITKRVAEITLRHTGEGFKRDGAPKCLIRTPVLGTAKRVITLRASALAGQFDEKNVESYQRTIGHMLGDDYGITRATLVIQRY